MPLPLQLCGTPAAYKRHLKAGQKPCDACQAAAREQANVRYQPKVGRRGRNTGRSARGPCPGCGKPMQVKPGSPPAEKRLCLECRQKRRAPRPCAACGKLFEPGKPGVRNERACCRVPCGVAVRMGLTLAEYEDKWRLSQSDGSQVWHANCVECGTLFIARRPDQKACNPECRRVYQNRKVSEGIMRRYYADPEFRDLVNTRAQNRRVTLLGLPGMTRPYHLVAYLMEADNGICGGLVIDEPGPHQPSPDHIVPLAREGAHSLDNLQLSHLSCNLAKNARYGDTRDDTAADT